MTDVAPPALSIVTPAYNEARNLPALYARLVAALAPGIAWEWIVVDDHSDDETFAVLAGLAARDSRVRGVRLARNGGSHAAILCALHEARGEAALVLSADLQDPPELVPQLLAAQASGADIVWAARADGSRHGGVLSRGFNRLFRRMTGLAHLPPDGADTVLLTRPVIDALLRFGERNTNVFALIAWLGFKQTHIDYVKQKRAAGASGWSFTRRVKLAVDSIAAFSYLPVRCMALLGLAIAALGFVFAVVVVVNAAAGKPPSGWSSLMVALLVLGGATMVMLGMVGEYLWRVLDEVRARPRYIVERRTDVAVVPETTKAGGRPRRKTATKPADTAGKAPP